MARRPVLTARRTPSPISLVVFGDLLSTDRIATVLESCKAVTHRQRKLPFVFTTQLHCYVAVVR